MPAGASGMAAAIGERRTRQECKGAPGDGNEKGRPEAPFFWNAKTSGHGLDRVGETGFRPRRQVLVDDLLVRDAIDDGLRSLELFRRHGLVAARDSLPDELYRRPQRRTEARVLLVGLPRLPG